MVHIHMPETEDIFVLLRQTMRKSADRPNIQVVEHNDSANRREKERSEQGVFSLSWIRRTVDQNNIRLPKRIESDALAEDIKGFDQARSVPKPA